MTKNDDFWGNFLTECSLQFNSWVVNNKDLLYEPLKKKLTKGGREHGLPIYSDKKIQKEIEAEFLDIIGWKLVRRWQSARKSIS